MVKDLAKKIGCTPGSASIAIKRLGKGGLVLRERNEKDERIVTVTLSEGGKIALTRWRDDQKRSMALLFDSLGPNEKKTLKDLLAKALGNPSGTESGKESRFGSH